MMRVSFAFLTTFFLAKAALAITSHSNWTKQRPLDTLEELRARTFYPPPPQVDFSGIQKSS